MYKGVALFALVTIAACGGSGGSDEKPTVCTERSGSYVERFAERSGNCGAIPEQVMMVNSEANARLQDELAKCEYSTLPLDAKSCRVELDLKCPGADGYAVVTRGVVDWSADASHASGIISMSLIRTSDQWTECMGTYAVTINRL